MECMRRKRNGYRVVMGKLKERDHFEELRADERIISKWMLNRVGGYGLG